MTENTLIILASILVFGVGAQWLAWRLRLPSILILLACGILVGPITGFLLPQELFGSLLQPVVSISVAVILFEGGLTLKFQELRSAGSAVVRLVTLGALVTWILAAGAAHLVLGMPLGLSTLLGAILIVTGPTVIQPLLQHIKPSGSVGKILKWEGIVIDPIGALLAVLVFELLSSDHFDGMTTHTAMAVVKTIVMGGALGVFGAGLYVVLAKRFLIPDYLRSAVSLSFAVAVFAASNHFQHESGLFAVTLMGVLLANQHKVDVEEVIEFKENLRVLLISGLFIVLGARLDLDDLLNLGWRGGVFVAFLVIVVRPASVFASMVGHPLSRRDKLFLSWMAPRGIVAAAVSSIFALELENRGVEGASALVATTFAVILGTVIVYGLTAPMVAYRLKIAEPSPQGILIVGADRWQRTMAERLKGYGFRVLLIDTNYGNIQRARMAGLECANGSALNEAFFESLDLGGIGRVFATTPNDYVNVLVVQSLGRVFGRANAFQVAPQGATENKGKAGERTHGRILFDDSANWRALDRRMAASETFKATRLSEEYTFEDFRERYGETALPLFLVTESKRLRIFATDDVPEPQAGQTLISLVEEVETSADAEGLTRAKNAAAKA